MSFYCTFGHYVKEQERSSYLGFCSPRSPASSLKGSLGHQQEPSSIAAVCEKDCYDSASTAELVWETCGKEKRGQRHG
ncbi:hypothetical protein AAVH_11916 [Aphelenchoides avenae]|nr:hypothetical protein AAVH_11916 [Aphelenchus avenae]